MKSFNSSLLYFLVTCFLLAQIKSLINGQSLTTCMTPGRFPSPNSSQTYILCMRNGNSYTQWVLWCVNGLVFKPASATCGPNTVSSLTVFPSTTTTQPTTTRPTTTTIPPTTTTITPSTNQSTLVCQEPGRIANPNDTSCRTYILCNANGTSYTPWVLWCVNGLVFRPTTKTCVTQSMYSCPGATNSTASPSTTTSIPTTESSTRTDTESTSPISSSPIDMTTESLSTENTESNSDAASKNTTPGDLESNTLPPSIIK